MSKSSAAHWVKFFNASGIPSPAAASYAHIFVENRMQSDMMMDLNKDYLREMGITRMGDIIAILRHAKTVNDQNAREKVLGKQNIAIPVATITASPIAPANSSSTKISLKPTNITQSAAVGLTHPLPKTPRRVLPEHEGKYKIKLPSGTTERSKEILAKREKLYSDRVSSSRKTDVFSRLANQKQKSSTTSMDDDSEDVVSSSGSNESNNVRVQVTGVSSATIVKRSIAGVGSSSVFSRLGGKAETEIARQIKPILKNTRKSSSGSSGVSSTGGSIVKAKNIASAPLRSQKVMLVTKVPVKRGDSDEESYSDNDNDDYDAAMECDVPTPTEKFVKFASTAEVREIAPISNYKPVEKSGGLRGGVKSRLGLVSKLHSTKRMYNMKASTSNNNRTSPVKGKTIRLKSDELLSRHELPVHQRLGKFDAAKGSVKGNIVQQRKSVDQRNDYKLKRSSSAAADMYGKESKRHQSSSSVFDRLGFNSSI